jgi:NitT/TauT family transport system permease protein
MFTPNQRTSAQHASVIALVWLLGTLLLLQIVPPPIIPRPLEIAEAWWVGVQNGSLVRALLASLMLNLEAVALSTVVSLAIAYSFVVPALRPAVLAVSKLRYLGFTGLTLAFMLVASGHTLKLSMLVFGMSTFFVTSMLDAIAAIPRDTYDHARTLRMGPWRVVWEVVVLGTLDKVFESIAMNGAIGWIMLTQVEGLVRAEGGLGVLLLNDSRSFNLEGIYALQFTVFGVAIACDYGFRALGRLVCPYAALGRAE